MTALRDQQGTMVATSDVALPQETDQWDGGFKVTAETPSAAVEIAQAMDSVPVPQKNNALPEWALSPAPGAISTLQAGSQPSRPLGRSDISRKSGEEVSTTQNAGNNSFVTGGWGYQLDDSSSLDQHNHVTGGQSYDVSALRLLSEHQKQDPRQRAGSMFQPMHMQPSQQEPPHHVLSRASWAAAGSSGETRLRGHAIRPASGAELPPGLPDNPLVAKPLTTGHVQGSRMDLGTWKSQLPLPPDHGPSRLPVAAEGPRDGAIRGSRSISSSAVAVQGPQLVRHPTIPLGAPAVNVGMFSVTPSHIGLVPWPGYPTRSTPHESQPETQPRQRNGVILAASSNVGPRISNGDIPVSISQEAGASPRLTQRASIMDQLMQAKEGLASTLHAVGRFEHSQASRKSLNERNQAGPSQIPESGRSQTVDAAMGPAEHTQERGIGGPTAERASMLPRGASNWSPERLVHAPVGLTTPRTAVREDSRSLGKTPSAEQSRATKSGQSRSFAVAQSSPTETRLRARQSAVLVNLRTRPPISSPHAGRPSDDCMWEPEMVVQGSHTHERSVRHAEPPPSGITLPIRRSDMHGLVRAEPGQERWERESAHRREPADSGNFIGEREVTAREMPELRRSLTDRLDHTLSQIESDLASLSHRAR